MGLRDRSGRGEGDLQGRPAAAARGRGERRAASRARQPLAAAARRGRAHGAAQADAAVVPRRAHARLRADDGGGRGSRDRPLAGRRAAVDVADDAGDHARGDHAGRLRGHRQRASSAPRRRPSEQPFVGHRPSPAGPARPARPAAAWRSGARCSGRSSRPTTCIFEEIRSRRDAPDLEQRDDVLSLLLQARHDDGSAMSDQELRDELMTLLVAGHETSATALAWALEALARHPACSAGCATRSTRATMTLPRCGRSGDPAAAPGDRAGAAAPDRAHGDRRAAAARRA